MTVRLDAPLGPRLAESIVEAFFKNREHPYPVAIQRKLLAVVSNCGPTTADANNCLDEFCHICLSYENTLNECPK